MGMVPPWAWCNLELEVDGAAVEPPEDGPPEREDEEGVGERGELGVVGCGSDGGERGEGVFAEGREEALRGVPDDEVEDACEHARGDEKKDGVSAGDGEGAENHRGGTGAGRVCGAFEKQERGERDAGEAGGDEGEGGAPDDFVDGVGV